MTPDERGNFWKMVIANAIVDVIAVFVVLVVVKLTQPAWLISLLCTQ